MPFHRVARVSDELLRTCDTEPIHIPESVQPHGALLVVDTQSWVIRRISENCQQFLGVSPQDLCGGTLDRLFDSPAHWERARTLLQSECREVSEARKILRLSGRLEHLICEAHAVDRNTVILEFEFPSEPEALQVESSHLNVIRDASKLIEDGHGLDAVLESISQAVRNVSGYDRVMIYRIDDQGHGNIVAESKREDLNSFLGWHFPATDIPKQARRLYLKNRVRLLSDMSYAAVPLICENGTQSDAPVDMSLCHLRSVSPVHVEYMQNMGVSATLVISIIIDNRLWGLIACHHYSPRHLDAFGRNRCEQLAHFISAVVRAEEHRQQHRAIESGHALHDVLIERIGTDVDWKKRLLNAKDCLLDPIEASGFAIYDEGEFHGLGEVPFSAMLEKVRRLLASRLENGKAMSHALKFEDSALAHIGADFAGCLLCEISQDPAVQVLWFRKEQRRVVNWGGNPTKMLQDAGTPDARLSPRKSFEKWTQVVEGQSAPWGHQDWFRAQTIARFIASRKIEDASRQRAQFLTNFSHEIRTPLTAVLGFTDLLADAVHNQRPTEQAQSISAIRNGGEQLLRIVEQVIALCRLETGEMPTRQEPLSTMSLIEELQSRFSQPARQRALDFECIAATPIPSVLVSDSRHLGRILEALIENALEFTEYGAVTVTFQCPGDSRDRLEILVQDTGPGIAPDATSRLFSPFHQLDGTLTRQHGGTGLGLTLAKQLAEAIGGDVQLKQTTPGLGTTFSLTLPVQQTEDLEWISIAPETSLSNPTERPQDATSLPLLGVHVLLVEDCLDNQRLLAFYLRRAGAEVTIAENGQVGLDTIGRMRASKTPLDLVLMDMQMPVMDGYQAVRALRTAGYKLPVIAVTAHAVTGDREKCLDAGCDDYLSKPVDAQQLVNLARQLTSNPVVSQVEDLFG